MFSKVLIANRGEIAGRIVRTLAPHGHRVGRRLFRCRSFHAACARCRRGGAPRSRAGRARAISTSMRSSPPARRPAREAVHPGYGFLSENRGFAEQLAAAWHRASSARGPSISMRSG